MTDCALGLDIDGVITAYPEFFSSLSNRWVAAGRQVHIVSSRSDQIKARQATINELHTLGIVYDHLYLLPTIEVAKQMCPHTNLNWYQKYVWQKVDYCLSQGIGIFYDDDEKVVELFRLYAPGIHIVHYGCGNNEVDINIQRKV